MLVLGSVLLGARIVAAADDSVPVWTVRVDVAAGQEITAAMVEVRQVRFGDAQQADRYLSGDEALPLPSAATRQLEAGELLPRGALGLTELLVEVPLRTSAGNVPSTVRVGDVVDVWVKDRAAPGRSMLEGVRVLALVQTDAGVRMVVGLDQQQAEAMPSLFGVLDSATVFVVRRPVA
jgi:hypothetical protein